MAIVKLISDFEGVWTNQETEAEYVRNYIVKNLSALTGDSAEVIRNLFIESKKEMERSPYEYGWFNNGNLAAYYQEDLFGDIYAILDYIWKAGSRKSYSNFKQHLGKIKDAITNTAGKTIAEFSDDCFTKSTSQFKLEGKLKPVENAGAAVKELNSLGVEIVVASNSKTDKVEHLFRKAGQNVTNESFLKRGRLHAIGEAKKIEIDNSYRKLPEHLEITKKYKVNLRRSNYHKILLDESPDYVLGDVFSVDLALPLYLRLRDKRFKKLRVILKIQKHTPAWVKDYLSKDELKGIAFMVGSVNEVHGVISNSK